ncbi:DEAD/DEAH box helicase [Bradyrhizobium sp. NBAIM32]|uniref:helicase-related protein n=1 Tax=Bradyrhizobium sp. NBAIM32 TaxID=2793809 RepID=UPI001CD4C210|nr:helicase-related protein [Bradyrhizobium sp. NBAIM32]MCA1542438.1 DEAD/DEAH box helicase [Bradyrhizobium sp. NBAIM32]
MNEIEQRPDVEAACRLLRDFQRLTVNYAFERLYRDADCVDRFLIADEVGLGKTWVAKGVIAHAVEHLWEKKSRIDVLYICSNAEIARQNVNRLNLGAGKESALASRLTLLPLELRDIGARKLNFVSFTPATSLDLGTSAGARRERAVLYWLLHEIWGISGAASKNLLQANAETRRWRSLLQEVADELDELKRAKQRVGRFDEAVLESFRKELRQDTSLTRDFEQLLDGFSRARESVPHDLRKARNHLIARLRRALARSCLAVFEPDLIVLDEFQRFRHLLQGEDEGAQLAQKLFASKGAKVLLLSATPYKMYTVEGEIDDDHHRDFIQTCSFLLPKNEVDAVERELTIYRKALCGEDNQISPSEALRPLEGRLRKVMCRTERLSSSADRDGMLIEVPGSVAPFEADDFLEYRSLARLAKVVKADDPIELWKSSPYLINIMEDSYRLKELLKDAIARHDTPILQALAELHSWQLPSRDIEAYRSVDPRNPRLRALIEEFSSSPLWKLLWLPPSLPYYEPQGAFQGTANGTYTKQLVFSSWKVVPRSIAIFVSYAMERLMVLQGDREAKYAALHRRHSPLLRWYEEGGDLGGMPLFALFYPCMTLAKYVDPLVNAQASSRVLRRSDLEREVGEKLSALLSPILAEHTSSSTRPDQRWYWAAPLLLDRHHAPEVRGWMSGEDQWLWGQHEGEEKSLFEKHVRAAVDVMDGSRKLGSAPADLLDVLTRICLGAPATVILRALMRHIPVHAVRSAWRAAASNALGFRSLFNLPESILLLNGLHSGSKAYWQKALDYCCDGNLQALMDEYIHVLVDLLCLDRTAADAASKIGEAIQKSVSLRTTTLAYDVYRVDSNGGASIRQHRVRCRFAQRFGDSLTDGSSDITRESSLREAFNSPFRPFVLASTSVGQEGLDFHAYSHALVHWNLPTNPVDMEQREGRVHRFKGHFIRKNLAEAYGIDGTKHSLDPWQSLFDHAVAKRAPGSSDMVPFWVFDGPFKVERRLPILPMSREAARISDLKESLALYRLTFGQPRQEELMELLKTKRSDAGHDTVDIKHIDLRPTNSSDR